MRCFSSVPCHSPFPRNPGFNRGGSSSTPATRWRVRSTTGRGGANRKKSVSGWGGVYQTSPTVSHATAPGIFAGLDVLGNVHHGAGGLRLEAAYTGPATYQHTTLYPSGEYSYTLTQHTDRLGLGLLYAFYRTPRCRLYALWMVEGNGSWYPVNKGAYTTYGGLIQTDHAFAMATSWAYSEPGLGVEGWGHLRLAWVF